MPVKIQLLVPFFKGEGYSKGREDLGDLSKEYKELA
jgi:hypothetical protein